ncbi:Ankyrin repeat-containing protein 9 [Elsinoe fawcettii]|nr:Ankyrin repeat-containing protein 9 [Elsinoe fawcettii]
MVELLIAKGADVNAGAYGGPFPQEHLPLLHVATEKGLVGIASVLLAAGVDINEFDKYGETALCKASAQNKMEMIRFLISRNADVEGTRDRSRKPLNAAAEHGHIEAAQILVNNGANVRSPKRASSAFCTAVRHGQVAMAKYLIQVGADLGTHGGVVSELAVAAVDGHLEMVRLLLDAGVDASGLDGHTALKQALRFGKNEMVARLLRDRGANESWIGHRGGGSYMSIQEYSATTPLRSAKQEEAFSYEDGAYIIFCTSGSVRLS